MYHFHKWDMYIYYMHIICIYTYMCNICMCEPI